MSRVGSFMLIKPALGGTDAILIVQIRLNYNDTSRFWRDSTTDVYGYSKSTAYSISSYPVDLGAGRMYITY